MNAQRQKGFVVLYYILFCCLEEAWRQFFPTVGLRHFSRLLQILLVSVKDNTINIITLFKYGTDQSYYYKATHSITMKFVSYYISEFLLQKSDAYSISIVLK
jgi:hypothetical protein